VALQLRNLSHSLVTALVGLGACGPAELPRLTSEPTTEPTTPATPASSPPVTLSIVGTSDLHGHLRALPLLAGHLAGLRRARAEDGGGVVLVDAGDMFQGTLESGLEEGASLGLPSTLIERAGVKVGIVGVSTEDTPHTTIAANFTGLKIAPLAESIVAQASSLRARGATVVVVAAHAGGRCTDFAAPDDLTTCDSEQEIMRVASALPPGLVDVIVAGHTHRAMAHRVGGVAIVQSYANGVAYGRVDVSVDRRTGAVVKLEIHPPRRLCTDPEASPEAGCASVDEHGRPVAIDPTLAAVIAPALNRADALRSESLGPTLLPGFAVRHRGENPPGNLLTDLMLRARPGIDVAILNGGGLRADLPAGPLRYGALYQALPFDNRFARVRLRADQLAAMLAVGLTGGSASPQPASSFRVRTGTAPRQGLLPRRGSRAEKARLGGRYPLFRVGVSAEVDRVPGQAGTGDRGLENTGGAWRESPRVGEHRPTKGDRGWRRRTRLSRRARPPPGRHPHRGRRSAPLTTTSTSTLRWPALARRPSRPAGWPGWPARWPPG